MLNENDRLTHEHANGWFASPYSKGAQSKYWTNATKTALMNRLGEYEDTGLTPEEIKEAARLAKPMPPSRSGKFYAWYYCCGACGQPLDPGDPFCRKCGQRVAWNDHPANE